MRKKRFYRMKHFLLCTIFFSIVTGQTPVLDEYGNETGMINMNPDPNGEPWIACNLPVTPEILEKLDKIPEFELPEKYKDREKYPLPEYVYNHEHPEFPTVFNQVASSCSQAAAIGVTYSYEINVLRGADGSSSENRYAYGFAYNFLNEGSSSQGTWYYDGWEIAKEMGAVNLKDFGSLDGGLSSTRWPDGYDKYHNANLGRVTNWYKFSIADEAGMEKMKQWMYDHANGDPKGGFVIFSWGHIFSFGTISSGQPQAGKTYLRSVGGGQTTHAMTFAGYDDRISFDLNNDGRITTDVDLNRDGVVDMRDKEKGAVLLVNTWGSNWGDVGVAWVPYSVAVEPTTGIFQTEVYVCEVADHSPKLEYKINIFNNDRNNILISSGFSNDLNTSSPDTSDTNIFAAAFNYSGGSYPMEGRGGSSTIEIGLDVSEYYDKMTGDSAKFFLVIESEGGSGQVVDFSLMDYTVDPAEEIECPDNNVSINTGTTTLSIIYGREPTPITYTAPEKIQGLKIRERSGGYAVYSPFSEKCRITVSDLKGRVLASIETNGKEWRHIPVSISSGVHVVNIITKSKIYVKKVNFIR